MRNSIEKRYQLRSDKEEKNLMKKFTIVRSAVLLFIFTAAAFAQPVRVMTFNIRLDIPIDGVNNWKYRKANLVSVIRSHQADIVGLQEAQLHQIDYISKALPEYAWFGVGRDDGKLQGEFTAIFYKKDRFDTLTTSTFWCSPTPERPGLGWDAAYQRITTFGKFKDKLNGKTFFLFNTHLDNEGAMARLESAKLIKQKIRSLCGDFPVILTGDFNSTPSSDPYKFITSKTKSDTLSWLFDSRFIAQSKPYGPNGTFTGFDLNAKSPATIDFIFVRKGIFVLSHGTLSDSFDGYLPSDHYPVFAELVF